MRVTPAKDFEAPDDAYRPEPAPTESITLEETGEVISRVIDDGETVVSRTKKKAREPETEERYSKRGKAKKRDITRALALRAAGHTIGEIAEHLGAAPSTITAWFTQYRRDAKAEDIDEMLDRTAMPLAAENLVHGLLAGDKDYTLETLKGRGRLKHHAAVKQEGTPTVVPLIVRFEMGAGNHVTGSPALPIHEIAASQRALPTVAVGNIVGVPALPVREGVIVEEK